MKPRAILHRTILALGLVLLAGPSASAPAATADSLRLVLNLPPARLDAFVGETRVGSWAVAVGVPGHRTPTGRFEIYAVTWNPWWIPPPFEWARGSSPTPPGPTSPVGRVKLRFHDLLYVHGTTDEASLGGPASHGCVRMANRDVIELARLVHRHAMPGVSEATLDRLVGDSRATRTFALSTPVPLWIRYLRVEVVDDRLLVHPDPYDLDPLEGGEFRQALLVAGLDATVHPDRLQAIAERASRGTVEVSPDELRGP